MNTDEHHNPKQQTSMRGILFFNMALCVLIIIIPVLMPKNDRVAVLVSPWGHSAKVMDVISKADGVLINGGKRDWIAVASSSSENSNNFVSKLYQSGAWLVIDGTIAAACL